jgi:hypothetical protein
MTQPRRILSFVVCLAALLLLPVRAAAQVSVTPVVQPTPPCQLIVVNNGPGNYTDPHVDGDLVSSYGERTGPVTALSNNSLLSARR